MGFLDKVFKRKQMHGIRQRLEMINAYSPVFTSFQGGLYEMDLTRTAIHVLATHTSKLNIVIKGNSYRNLEKILRIKPNDNMTLSQFLYRLRTIYEVENNAYIIPIYADNGDIIGLYPISTIGSSIVNRNGKVFLRYMFNNEPDAIEYDRVGHLKKMQYKSEFFGESNAPLSATMDMIETQNQGIKNSVKSSAVIRFIGKISGAYKTNDLIAERKRLEEENFDTNNPNGILLIDKKYDDFKQITPQSYVVDSKQQELIQTNIQNYFGVSIEVIQNKANEEVWNATYEGAIEPFGIQLSQVLTKMLYTTNELSYGNEVLFEANRLQFMSPKTKIEMITQLSDRGMMTTNQGLTIMNMPTVLNGDKRYIRREYVDVDYLDKELINDEEEVKDDLKG
ncbi:phage portal protein [Anaerorhabdus sp.]|uniref:phage portal protein n=1 Tax=Anaerorhabdus sp. TaxID=1872524 RepID=UPI002FC634B5